MIITNIYLRLCFGCWTIFIGIILLKIHHDRHKDNLWGRFYRLGREVNTNPNPLRYAGRAYLLLGWLSIAGGLIALFFGFRLRLVG
jgi:hypothetical protein